MVTCTTLPPLELRQAVKLLTCSLDKLKYATSTATIVACVFWGFLISPVRRDSAFKSATNTFTYFQIWYYNPIALYILCFCKGVFHIFYQKYMTHLQILGATKVKSSKFHTEDLQILGATVQNLIACAT